MVSTNRILRVWPFWPEGLKYHDQHLAEAMAKDGVETIFAFPAYSDKSYSMFASDSSKEVKPKSYSIFPLSYINILGKPLPFNWLSFIKRIRSFDPSVVHIYGLSNFTTYFTLACLGVLRFKGKVIFNDHSDPTEKKTSIVAKIYYLVFKALYHLFIRNRFPVIVPDGGSKQELIARYGNSIEPILSFIPLGFDADTFNLARGSRSKDSPLVVGFAGKIVPAKRIEVLLEVAEEFSEADLEVWICGFAKLPDDYQRNLLDKLQNSAFQNIKFYDFHTEPNALAEFYGSVDLAIYPGSISITTFEANGTGCPILLYESLPGLEHRVADDRGYLFSEVDQLRQYIKDYIILKANGGIDHAAVYRSSLRYSWGNLKYEYYRVYEWDIAAIKNPV
jgi:glycosyltransferase involved in cell wall biosynthesis